MIFIYIKGKKVGKGKDMKEVLKHVARLFKEGHTDVIVSGGRIGKWR